MMASRQHMLLLWLVDIFESFSSSFSDTLVYGILVYGSGYPTASLWCTSYLCFCFWCNIPYSSLYCNVTWCSKAEMFLSTLSKAQVSQTDTLSHNTLLLLVLCILTFCHINNISSCMVWIWAISALFLAVLLYFIPLTSSNTFPSKYFLKSCTLLVWITLSHLIVHCSFRQNY